VRRRRQHTDSQQTHNTHTRVPPLHKHTHTLTHKSQPTALATTNSTRNHTNSIARLIQELDPKGTGAFIAGSDAALLSLIRLCFEAGKLAVPRVGHAGEVRLVVDVLCNPVVVHRLVRHLGLDYVIDSVLKGAVSMLDRQRDFQGVTPRANVVREERAMIGDLTELCVSMRQYVRKFPSTTVGAMLSKAMAVEQQERQGQRQLDAAAAGGVRGAQMLQVMQGAGRRLVAEAGRFTASLQEHAIDDGDEVVEAASDMQAQVQAAIEAGAYELFDPGESGEVEAALEAAADAIHEWSQSAGKRRLLSLLASQAALSPALAASRDAASSATPAPGDPAAQDATSAAGAAAAAAAGIEAEVTAEGQAADMAGMQRAREAAPPPATPRHGVNEAASDAVAISQVSALLKMGAMAGGSETRALMRVDLAVALDDMATLTAQSVGGYKPQPGLGGGGRSVEQARGPVSEASDGAGGYGGNIEQDAIKAVRSALLSAIYASGKAQGLVARIVRMENLACPRKLRVPSSTLPPRAPPAVASQAGRDGLAEEEEAAAAAKSEAGEAEQAERASQGVAEEGEVGTEGRQEGVVEAEQAELVVEEGTGGELAEAAEVELEARSYALVQLSRTADSVLRLAAGERDDEPHAAHAVSDLCVGWFKTRACELHGSLVVDALPVRRPSCFLVLSLIVSAHDLDQLSEDDFAEALSADVARALAAVSGHASGRGEDADQVRLVKMSPRRNFAILDIEEPDSDMPQRTQSLTRVSSSSHKVQRHSEVWLLNKLQDASVCGMASRWVVSAVMMRGFIPPLMPGERAQVKLFNSSTFSDMHCERDLLNARVYPAMRAVGLDRRIDFSWIDFRWGGVTEDDSNKKLGVLRCLEKIEECNVPLQRGVCLPLVVAIVGERCGWVPAADAPERHMAARRYPWTLPDAGEEFGGEGAALPRSDDYSKYSVTGLEMALAHLRFPHAAECFFYLRDRSFLDTPTWRRLPHTARSAFEDAPAPPSSKPHAAAASSSHADASAAAAVPLALGPGDAFTTRYLRALVEREATGRFERYTPSLSDVPYAFSTQLVLGKLKDTMADVQDQTALLQASTTSDAAHHRMRAELRAQQRLAVSWWRLLVEQHSHEWRAHISDLDAAADADVDADAEALDSHATEGAQPGVQDRAARVLEDIGALLEQHRGTLEGWIKDLGHEAPAMGNTNVAAKGVNLKIGTLGCSVMLNLMEVFDAVYPEPCKMPGSALHDMRDALGAYLEELSASFVCLPQGSRIQALSQLDDALHPHAPDPAAIDTVIVLQGEADSGRSALLARFLHNHLYVSRDRQALEHDYCCSPLPADSNTARIPPANAAPNTARDLGACKSVHLLDQVTCWQVYDAREPTPRGIHCTFWHPHCTHAAVLQAATGYGRPSRGRGGRERSGGGGGDDDDGDGEQSQGAWHTRGGEAAALVCRHELVGRRGAGCE